MNLKDFVMVTGIPGVQKIVASKNNGMLVSDLDSGKVRFASLRKHQFSPLKTISMYTDDDDSVELKTVFQNMLNQLADSPLPDAKASAEAHREYFAKILPNYDREKVHVSDMKKAIRWFAFLHERDLLNLPDDEETGEASEEEE